LEDIMAEPYLPTLLTPDAEAGFQLAIKLARLGVKFTQPSAEIRAKLRPIYEESADALIASSQVVAINFQTVAQANNYWR
jgi:hypothetical protein